MNCCCVCGRDITGTSWLCHRCARDNAVEDTPFAEWPAWLKMFKRQEETERRRDTGGMELTFTDCPEAERIAYGELIGVGEWD